MRDNCCGGSGDERAIQANPINRITGTRGPAKTDVYRTIGRIYLHGLHKLDVSQRLRLRAHPSSSEKERRDIAAETKRLGRAPNQAEITQLQRKAEDELWAAIAADHEAGRAPDHLEIAKMLIAEADYLRYVADWGSESWLAEITAGLSDHQTGLFLKQFWRDGAEQKRRVTLQALAMAANQKDASEQVKQCHRDWSLLFDLKDVAPNPRVDVAWKWANNAFNKKFDRPASPVPVAINQVVEKVLRAQKRREIKAAASFEKQLGNLRDQTTDEQRSTVADWVRNARRLGYVPPLPARPLGLARD